MPRAPTIKYSVQLVRVYSFEKMAGPSAILMSTTDPRAWKQTTIPIATSVSSAVIDACCNGTVSADSEKSIPNPEATPYDDAKNGGAQHPIRTARRREQAG